MNKKAVNSELIIDVSKKEISIALTEDKRLVELHKEGSNSQFSVGDFYLGKVKKVMPGLNAAFVNVGYEKDAFLHYLDLGPQFNSLKKALGQAKVNPKKPFYISKLTCEPDIEKNGAIAKVLAPGQEILVQIAKEPISTKGPRLTSELSIAGRYLVLIPFSNRISVSQKIDSTEEKSRLKTLIRSIRPKNFGVIIRTVAQGQKVAELDSELKLLVKRWNKAMNTAAQSEGPALIHNEIGRSSAILRDLLNDTFSNIIVNDEKVFNELNDFVGLISPEQKKLVSPYKKDNPILDEYGITAQVKASFGKTVSFKRGAYLVIEHTEAFHVVDVNSGNRTKNNQDQETNAYEVNLAAAEEVARQLRLRDMGGIIVVDFIDMGVAENRQNLFDNMRKFMDGDKARHHILPLSKFGLMQITRQRVRPEMNITIDETCPSCGGTGKVKPSVLFVDRLEGKIDYLFSIGVKAYKLHVHPYVYAYLTKKPGLFSSCIFDNWKRHYSKKINLMENQDLAMLEYLFVDENGEEIVMKEEVDTKL